MATTFPLDKTCFGGSLLKGRAKRPRPLNHQAALHLVLRSSMARGNMSLVAGDNQGKIHKIIVRQCKSFGLELYRYANSGNHLHLLVRPPKKREDYAGFIRAISGLIAKKTLLFRLRPGQHFWDARPFSRIISWGTAFRSCARYIDRNILEAFGFEAYQKAISARVKIQV